MSSGKPWSFAQKVNLRVSTMLYLWVALVWGICWVFPPYQLDSQSIRMILGGLGNAAIAQLVIASVFGLTFLISSLVNRNPQAQYLVEAVVGLAIFISIPAY